MITTLNLTEVVKKLRERGVPSVLVDITITELQIPVRAWPSDATQAIQTGELASASRRFGLSLGDCVCLAAAAGWGLTAVTAEHRWTAALPTAQIINIREAPPSPGA